MNTGITEKDPASSLETSRELFDLVQAFVLKRRAHATKCLAMAQEKDCPEPAQQALRNEAEVADAVASGIESALAILF